MAKIVTVDKHVMLSEEQDLGGKRLGWIRDGNDVFLRCDNCRHIIRARDISEDLHDGAGTCITCAYCKIYRVYIFAGLKSDHPRHTKKGTYRVCATQAAEDGVKWANPKTCPCGGTLVDMNPGCGCHECQGKYGNQYVYCLSCLKKAED